MNLVEVRESGLQVIERSLQGGDLRILDRGRTLDPGRVRWWSAGRLIRLGQPFEMKVPFRNQVVLADPAVHQLQQPLDVPGFGHVIVQSAPVDRLNNRLKSE